MRATRSFPVRERGTQLYEDAGFAVVLYYIAGSPERKVGFVKL